MDEYENTPVEELGGTDYYEVILDEFRDHIEDSNEATVGLIMAAGKIAETIGSVADDVTEVEAISTDVLEATSAMKGELTRCLDENTGILKEVDADVDDLVIRVKTLEAEIAELKEKSASKCAVVFCAVAAAVAAIAAVAGLFL